MNRAAPAPESRVLSFSSAQLPAHLTPEKKAALWLETIANANLRADVDIPDRANFYGAGKTAIIGSSTISWGKANAVRVQRNARHIALDQNDSVFLLLHNGGGPVGGSQFGRDVILSDGGAAIFDCKDAQLTQTRAGGAVFSLHVPRQALSRFGIEIEDHSARLIDSRTEALRLLRGYLKILLDTSPHDSAELASISETHVGELLALALGLTADMAHQARSNGLRAARLSALRHAIAKNATRHDITIENFAKMLGLSPRYLQHLLYSEGTTLTDELTAQRLNHANRLLQDAASREKSIAEIAQQSGFAELSTFYHAFRRMFGMTPGQLRMDGRDRSAE